MEWLFKLVCGELLYIHSPEYDFTEVYLAVATCIIHLLHETFKQSSFLYITVIFLFFVRFLLLWVKLVLGKPLRYPNIFMRLDIQNTERYDSFVIFLSFLGLWFPSLTCNSVEALNISYFLSRFRWWKVCFL